MEEDFHKVLIFLHDWFYNFHEKIFINPLKKISKFFNNITSNIANTLLDASNAILIFLGNILNSIKEFGSILYTIVIAKPYNQITFYLNWLSGLNGKFLRYFFDLLDFFTSDRVIDWILNISYGFITLSVKIIGDLVSSLFDEIIKAIPNSIFNIIDSVVDTIKSTGLLMPFDLAGLDPIALVVDPLENEIRNLFTNPFDKIGPLI